MTPAHVVTATGPRCASPLGLAALDGVDAPAVVSVHGRTAVTADPVARVTDMAGLADVARLLGWRDGATEDPTPGALAVGWLTDDCSPGLLALGDLGADRPAPAPLAPIDVTVHDTVAWLDPEGGPATIVAADVPGLSRRPASERVAAASARLSRAARAHVPANIDAAPGAARSSLSRSQHAAAVARTLGWIADGDLYQLNLTAQLAVPWRSGGAALADRLWQANPGAAHAAWLRAANGTEVVSVSPETFLVSRGDEVTIRPIKGTRPRRRQPADDASQAAALLGSAKDRAEHVMIVDLERNDLGRVCEAGTVAVPELAELEAHPTVWHLTSTVSGRLRSDVGLDDLLAATFPCGSVTGAPKRMSWSRSAQLEPVRRGVYCGAIGAIGPGFCDLSVAIRTAVVADGVASYGAGGGLVADSDPAAEWDELVDKAAAFLRATGAHPPT